MRTRTTWLIVLTSLAVVLAVMGWVTATLLSLDSERTQTEREGVVEEQTRLALWRVDSAMTPILAREVALFDAPQGAEQLAPPSGVIMRFALDASGLHALTQASPQQHATLAGSVSLDGLLAELGGPAAPIELAAVQADDGTPYALKTQSLRNEDEWSRRRANAEDNLAAYGSLARSGVVGSGSGSDKLSGTGNDRSVGSDDELDAGELDAGELEPAAALDRREPNEPVTIVRALWIDDKLLLVRGAGTSARRSVQGSWLDWPALRALLLDGIVDLLPHAELLAVADPQHSSTDRLLATLPARLEPGATIAPPPTWSPLRASLVAAWLIVIAALVLVTLLVRASTLLSERRATFVSAVTHELRTPLTTFRMYTEMLGDGMVVEHKRARYVEILRREAERLSGLVENVLAYAQIESDRQHDKLERVSVGALLDRVLERLRERCEAADMQLELELDGSVRELELIVDPTAVEQILFNLVDNASKYARPDTQADAQARVCLALEPGARVLAMHVRDFGPGIAPEDARRIFEPFTKAKADASGTKPGVGLGLALSRRLARQMGGDLRLRSAATGADFVLTLRRA